MTQLANKLTLYTDPNRKTKMMDIITVPNPLSDPKGKRKVSFVPLPEISSKGPSPKKLRVTENPLLQVVDYPTPTMENPTGKKINTERAIVQHYSSLKLQAGQERDVAEQEARDVQSPQLISALDRKSQLMKIVVIQPAAVGDAQKKKVTEFKLSMNQFSVTDKVDFFRQTSELICSNLISTSVSKDKLFRDVKKLEGKVKTEQAEKKALQIKKTKLEKKVVEMSKGNTS